MHVARRCQVLLVVTLLASTLTFAADPQRPVPARTSPGPITIEVDATQAAQNLFHSRLIIPVTPGPLTLLYPKWIPGEHGPTGPVINSAAMKFTAGGRVLPWHRDDEDMYTIHVDIPPGLSQLEIALDYLAPVSGQSGFSGGSSSTDKMAVLSWNWLLLYPAGLPAEQLTYRPRLKLPPGWKFGTALPLAETPPQPSPQPQTLVFQPATLYTLVDSPVIMGEYYRAVPLSAAGEARPTEMDIAADSAAALDMSPGLEGEYRQLVAEAGACRRGGRAVRRPALPRLPFPAFAQQPRGALRPGTPRIQRQPHQRTRPRGRQGAQVDGRPAAARVRAFLERQVPPSPGPEHP